MRCNLSTANAPHRRSAGITAMRPSLFWRISLLWCLSLVWCVGFMSTQAIASDTHTDKTHGFKASAQWINLYVFRGILQSSEDFALQGGIDHHITPSTYIGAWGSWVSGGEPQDLETDFYIGHVMKIQGWQTHFSLISYNYHRAPEVEDEKEALIAIQRGPWQLSLFLDIQETKRRYSALDWQKTAWQKHTFSARLGYHKQNVLLGSFFNYRLGWTYQVHPRWLAGAQFVDTYNAELSEDYWQIYLRHIFF